VLQQQGAGKPMHLPPLNSELKLDPKGRLMLPRQLRSALELAGVNRLVAFANSGAQGGLALYTLDEYEAMSKRYQGSDPMDPKARLFALAISSTAQTVHVDNAGRMLVPQALRQLLGLEKRLHLFSAGSWFEIWDGDRWESKAYPQASTLWDQIQGFGSISQASADQEDA
jgi:MraZ protein